MTPSVTAPSFPRIPLLGAALLILATFALVFGSRLSGLKGVTAVPAAAVATRDLVFADRSDGSVVVIDAQSRLTVAVLPRGSDGFVRATMRGLARDRHSRGIGPEAPFRLTERADDALTLEDPATGRFVELEAFGRTNADSFARFLHGTVAGTAVSAAVTGAVS